MKRTWSIPIALTVIAIGCCACSNGAAKMAADRRRCESKYGVGKCREAFGTWVPTQAAFPVQTVGPIPTIAEPSFPPDTRPPPAAIRTPLASAKAADSGDATDTPSTLVWENGSDYASSGKGLAKTQFTVRGNWDVNWRFWFAGDPNYYEAHPSCTFGWKVTKPDGSDAGYEPFTEVASGDHGVTGMTGSGSFYIRASASCSPDTAGNGSAGWDIKVYD